MKFVSPHVNRTETEMEMGTDSVKGRGKMWFPR